MDGYFLEVCVDSYESAWEAKRGGADRLLLCGNLMLGGTTPDINLFYQIRNHIDDLEVQVLLRPRAGDFCYTENEFEVMKDGAAMFCDAGAQGIAVGFLTVDGDLDVARMDDLMTYTKGMDIVLNRAFDFCRDPMETLEQAKMLGLSAIITSGQQPDCYKGRNLIARLAMNSGDVNIFACGGITSQNIESLLTVTGVNSYVMTGKKEKESPMRYRKNGFGTGLFKKEEYKLWYTDAQEIAKVRAILNFAK